MTKPMGEYVYHASNLPDQSAGLKSMMSRGLQPSRDGYAGKETPKPQPTRSADMRAYFNQEQPVPAMQTKKSTDNFSKLDVPNNIKIILWKVQNKRQLGQNEYMDLKMWHDRRKLVGEAGAIKLTPPDTKVTDFIEAVYTKYPHTFQNNHVMLMGGTGDDQQFAMFELVPSFSRRGAVEVKWFQAYPLRQGVGSRAMQELQAMAREDGIALTLYPWDKGQVSQAKLTKFYRGQGFTPAGKGTKNMAWTPESLNEAFDQPYPMTWEKSEADDSMDALARLPDGSNLSIMFNMEYDEEGEEVIQVEFHRNNSQEVTGDGDAQRVFATVLAAIQQYIKTHNPKRLTFSASKEVEPDQNSESRAKLYDRLVMRYARTWGYRPLRADTGTIVRYELSRVKPVAEAETGTAHADQIEKEFTALGYKLIGSGADSTVWAKNKGHIIKILMPESDGQAEQVFTKFYEFCLAHQDLECLPVINEHNKISVLDREYTQIDMERLSHIKKNSFNEGVIWFFSDFVAGGESWNAVDHALGLADTWTEYNPRQAANLAKYWQDLTFADDHSKLKELHTLYGVMQILYKAGRINKFGWDLHTENVMQRKNGQLVIIDPWFADSTLGESVAEARTNPEQNVKQESVEENFADGKGPGRAGDSQRHGIPKGATMAELEKASHASGRKGQLARWQLNMRRGKKAASESINEGGWASTATQNTVITPRTVAEMVEILKQFEASYNAWQATQGLDTEIKIGQPKGSGTYYKRDLAQDPGREYGDVDVECFIHSRAGVGSAARTAEYRQAIQDYCLQSPDYNTDNGTNVIMSTSDGPVQVDLIYTYHEHANWSRALSPEYRVKGVISASLTSALAEVLNLSFSSQGVQVKIRNGQPVSFRQSKDTQLRTVSTNPETWAKDIYALFYYLADGTKPESFPGGLEQHSGLKDEQRLSDIVLAIKALATALEQQGLLGHASLIGIADKKDMMRRVAGVYAKKLETAENSSKFDKAATPAADAKAAKTKVMLAKYRNEITKLLLN